MSNPKRHHYVAQFLLRGFTDGQGRLHVYRKSDGRSWTSKPENVFLEGHLYSTIEEDGTREAELERAYSQLEGATASIAAQFIASARQGRTPDLTAEDKAILISFFYQQLKRVPEMFRQLAVQRTFADRLEDAIKKLEARIGQPLTDEEASELRNPASLARIQQNATLKALADPGQLIQSLLFSMSVEIAVAPAGESFVIGSQPVARIVSGTSSNLLDPDTYLWLPIASDIAVRFAGSGPPVVITSVPADHVFRINRQILSQSETVAAGARATIDALLRC